MVGEKALSKIIKDGLNPEQRVDKIFKRIDKDGDEKITLNEFKKAAAEDPSLVMLLQINGAEGGDGESNESTKKPKK